ncbi:MAG: hypothetical protein SCALA701_20410 [Candidatus Scalindua sp.]|nr:hypothetical protein [Planctomycetota bacterium]GJQ59240.1 MAG: hypothetical protein SCALA701_20410 [Candidatus Scalindua sp.]
MNLALKNRFLCFFICLTILSLFLCSVSLEAEEALVKQTKGDGNWVERWKPIEMFRWWDPAHYFEPDNKVQGVFEAEKCVTCHTVVTPGITNEWKKSTHSFAGVTCDKCHGSDHQKIEMPAPDDCAECHPEQVKDFKSEKETDNSSHARAFHANGVDEGLQGNKQQPETAGFALRNAIENKCDSCHFRHRFDAAEARQPEACSYCHNGPGHRETEYYNTSAHGAITKIDGDNWDWDKPLKVGNYRAPTCAYCHMYKGTHNTVENAVYANKGVQEEVDSKAKEFVEKRKAWLNICNDCHSTRFASAYLRDADETVKVSFAKVKEAKTIIEELQKSGRLDPMPKHLPSSPDERNRGDLGGRLNNVSVIEREFIDMNNYHTETIFPSVFHMSVNLQTNEFGTYKQDQSLARIKAEASKLGLLKVLEEKVGAKYEEYDFWKVVEFPNFLKVVK